jgi:hypothetical protein
MVIRFSFTLRPPYFWNPWDRGDQNWSGMDWEEINDFHDKNRIPLLDDECRLLGCDAV